MKIELGMASPEPENRKFVPETSARPHHITEVSAVRAALGRRRNPSTIANEFIAQMEIISTLEQIPGYSQDVVGETAEEKEAFRQGIEAYFTKLYMLSDTAYIQLDLERDGVCTSCVHGKHCDATNFQVIQPGKRSTPERESEHVDRIQEDLERAGYHHGEDFIIRGTTHVLQNYGGEILTEDAQSSPQKVQFNSLIVRVGALRDIY